MTTLKDLRLKAGLTQHALAEKAGMRQATVSSLENGRTRPQSGTVHALAAALGAEPKMVREALAAIGPADSAAQKPTAGGSDSFDPQTLGELEWNWKNAKRATEGLSRQWKEAMMFLDPILKNHPAFLEARMLMRKCEIEASLKIPLSDRIPPPQSYIGKAQRKIAEGEPLKAIEILEEKVFVYLPRHIKANTVLHEAASEAGLPRTARFALKFAAAQNPKSKEIFQRLADHYQESGELAKACDALKRVTQIDPEDLEAGKAHRDMMARASMESGKIEIKDPEGRLELEMNERLALTDEQRKSEIERLVRAFHDHGQGEDSDAASSAREGLRRAVKLARELGESDVTYLDYALELQHFLVEAFPRDPVLLAQIDELELLICESKLQRAEVDGAEAAKTQASLEKAAPEVERLRAERAQMKLEIAERAVLANPTNAEAQLRLGQAYMEAGNFRGAVGPLQKAKKDPRAGIDLEAMGLLSDCFVEGGLLELAVKELDLALEKLDTGGGEKADIHWKALSYKKALLFLQMKNEGEAKLIFSEIYAKDSGFEDVEERVWGG